MRGILIVIMVVCAGPAFAQQLNCRGLTPLQFEDGGKGCIHSIRLGTFSHIKSVNGRQFSRVEFKAMYMNAVMEEGYSDRSQRQRMLTMCKRYLGEAQKRAEGEKFERIVLRMSWPKVATPQSKKRAGDPEMVVQKGHTNANCRNFDYF